MSDIRWDGSRREPSHITIRGIMYGYYAQEAAWEVSEGSAEPG